MMTQPCIYCGRTFSCRPRPNPRYCSWGCHTCDNPICFNPDHLFLGDHNANMADRQKKGRTQSGERHNMAKLTADQVARIRQSTAGTDALLAAIGDQPPVPPAGPEEVRRFMERVEAARRGGIAMAEERARVERIEEGIQE